MQWRHRRCERPLDAVGPKRAPSSPTMSPLNAPLRFERVFLEKVWGGRALGRSPAEGGLGLELPDEVAVGETWEIVDRADVNSVVAEGSLVGARLEELMRDHAGDLLGDAAPSSSGRFPLLVKYIDAAQHLSVQVHPRQASLAGLTSAGLGAGAEAKTEAWVILGCEEQGRIYHGFGPGVERAAFEADVRAGVSLERHLAAYAPLVGDCFFVPGGTVHAIGGGVTLLEVQQNSDTTYRVSDWGRMGLDGKPRELHVGEALEVLDFGPAPAPVSGQADGVLAACAHFELSTLNLTAPRTVPAARTPRALACVSGAATLHTSHGEWPLALGDVWLLPAALGEHVLAPSPTSSTARLIAMDAPPADTPA